MKYAVAFFLLLQSFATPPREKLENPAAVTAIPKTLQNDYDNLWKRFLNSKTARDDNKTAGDIANLLKKNKDFPPLLVMQAYLSFYGGQPATAEQQFGAVLSHDPGNRIALYYLAELSFSRNDFPRAADIYDRLLAVDHTHPEVEPKHQRALLLATDNLLRNASQAEESGRLADTEEIYRQALLRAPQAAFLHGLLGGVLARDGKWPEALSEFQRQIELEGPGSESQRHVVEALTNLGRSEEARALSDRFDGAGPREADPQRGDRELEDLGRWGTDIARFRVIVSSSTITREQFAALMVRYFPQMLELPRTPQVVTDIDGSWAFSEIQTVVALGILDPMGNHTFQPSRTVTRGEFALGMSRLSRLAGATPSGARPIPTSDLDSSSPLYQDVQLVLGYGLLSPDNAGKFGTDEPVSGKEAVSAEFQMTSFLQSFQQLRH